MTDIFSKEKRSEIMRRVRNKDTNIELKLRRELFRRGYRFRVRNKLFGKPDILFPREKVAIFCDGDFWHGKNFNRERRWYKKFWVDKIQVNIKRDKEVNRKLIREGWKVFRFWKSEILKNPSSCVDKIKDYINSIDSNRS